MEALAAVGLASSVLQLVQFGADAAGTALALYQSSDGALASNVELEKTTADLKRINLELASSIISKKSSSKLTTNENAIYDLARSSQNVCEDLLDMLNELKIHASRSKLQVMLQTAKTIWSKKKIEGMKENIGQLRQQLSLRLLAMLSDQNATLTKLITNLASTHDSSVAEYSQNLAELKQSLTDDLSRLLEISFEKLSLLSQKVQATQNRFTSILESLRFRDMRVRHADINDAHRNTFEWVFSKSASSFVDWMTSESGIFWISGKAGSGKSTLLKYIGEHSLTKRHLQTWAGDQDMYMASHYFWSPGTKLQKSLEGLFQTLLYQILLQCPLLIPILCPSRFTAVRDIYDPWTTKELLQAFDQLVIHTKLVDVKFCFFIDGLDEYNGDHGGLVKLLTRLNATVNIKLCVSSRPWNDFVRAYGDSRFQLAVQDLTKDDINYYIKDQLGQHFEFESQLVPNSWKDSLVQEIASKAHGVFLWVFLVVRSVLRGLSNDDEMSELMQRIAELPEDLEEYFRHILQRVDKVYQQQTYRIFQVAVTAIEPLPFLAISCLDKERENSHYALQAGIQQLQPASEEDVDKIRRRLNARCKDLLEIRKTEFKDLPIFHHRIEFLHRTVRDFLLTGEMDEVLRSKSGLGFDPRISLCKMYLFISKNFTLWSDSSLPDMWLFNRIVRVFNYYASEAERHDDKAQTQLCNDMWKVTAFHREGWEYQPHDGKICELTMDSIGNFSFFFESAIVSDLLIYVRDVLSSKETSWDRRIMARLLYVALDSRTRTTRSSRVFESLGARCSPAMVSLLLRHEANPNDSIGALNPPTSTYGDTIWEQYLVDFLSLNQDQKRYSDLDYQEWSEFTRLLILEGADLNICFRTGDKTSSISEMLSNIIPDADLWKIKQAITVKSQLMTTMRTKILELC